MTVFESLFASGFLPPSPTVHLPILIWPSDRQFVLHKNWVFDYHCRISCHLFSYTSTDQISTLPSSAYPVTLHDQHNSWLIDSYNSYCPTLPSKQPTSFEAFCSLLEDWESQLLSDFHLHFDPFILISKLESSPFRACSDGSAVTQEGTCGWALALEDGTRLAYGTWYADGQDPCSFCAEGQGMLSVVCFLRRLIQWTDTNSVLEGVLATDNIGPEFELS
jgi:hypothetical protein